MTDVILTSQQQAEQTRTSTLTKIQVQIPAVVNIQATDLFVFASMRLIIVVLLPLLAHLSLPFVKGYLFPYHMPPQRNFFWRSIVDPSACPTAYSGPQSSISEMEAGIDIEDIGIKVLVGPSVAATGRGLFVSLGSDVDEVVLPVATPICGYSKGEFKAEDWGDKTVGYGFENIFSGVIFDKKLMPLFEAITAVTKNASMVPVSDVVLGHTLYLDGNNSIAITKDQGFKNFFFVPDEVVEWGPSNLGLFANDFGFNFEIQDSAEYDQLSDTTNILQIVWRMEYSEGKLRPTWPVVILKKDTKFINKEPMEVGIHYSWSYWEAMMNFSFIGGELSDDGDDDDDHALK